MEDRRPSVKPPRHLLFSTGWPQVLHQEYLVGSACKWIVLHSLKTDDAYLIAEEVWDGVTFPAGEKICGGLHSAYQEAVRRHENTVHEGELIECIVFD
jgi:hypothetical protein